MTWIVVGFWACSAGLRKINVEVNVELAPSASEALKVFETLKTPNEVGYFSEFKVTRKMPS